MPYKFPTFVAIQEGLFVAKEDFKPLDNCIDNASLLNLVLWGHEPPKKKWKLNDLKPIQHLLSWQT